MANERLKDKVADLPESSGVYIFKDGQGAIIYIGKAKDLKKRVQTYFSRQLNSKTQAMVAKIADIEYRLTPQEAQAQILEASLIKQYQPQYNISLKDDKTFPWIKISDEEFPIVSICRRKKAEAEDQASYFGAYTNVDLLRQAFKLMRRVFAFRSCKTLPKEPCLYYRPACDQGGPGGGSERGRPGWGHGGAVQSWRLRARRGKRGRVSPEYP